MDEHNIRFIPNSLTGEELNLAMNGHFTEGKIKVIYTGNIGLAQDILKLLLVAERLQEYGHIEFVIIGYGFRKNEVEDMIEQKGLTNIKLISAKNRKSTLKEFSSAHIAYVSLVKSQVFDKVLPGKVIFYLYVRGKTYCC